jgi:hypothetical protein
LEFLDRKELWVGARHHKIKSVLRSIGGEAREDFIAALVGKKKLPAEAIMAIEGRRRRGDLQTVAIAANESAAANVSLDKAFGLKFGVGVGDGGAMDAEQLREFAAGGNAVAGAKITGVNKGPKLVAKLDVQGNMAFGLKVYWQHCLSP